MESKRASELQIAGNHYREMAIQPSEFIQRNGLNWCEGNIVKYLCRHRNKNGAQDVQKAIHYAELLLEWEYSGMTKTAADYTPLSPEDVQTIVDEIDPPRLCDTCIRHPLCGMKEAMAPSLDNGACVQYLPREGDGEGVESTSRQWTHEPEAVAAPTSCRDCWSDCGVAGEEREAAGCQSHTPMAEGLKLPTITVEGDLLAVYSKLKEEMGEWIASENGSMEELIEAWDVIQVAQTYKERGGGIITRTLPCIEDYYSINPERTIAAKRAMIVKNAARAMYAPEVCLKIVMSGGKEW